MVKLRMQIDWDHTAAMVATLLNCRMGTKRTQMVNPEKINPYRTSKRTGGKIRIADMARGFGAK